jgi:hypothetical protein
MKALNKFVDQLAKNAAKQPGWVPLLIFCYLVLPFIELPTSIQLIGRSVELSQELWAGVVTLVLFLIGDALDKGVYKALEPRVSSRALVTARNAARSTLEIHDGIYDIAKSLATAAGVFQTFTIQFLNETAKFLRSLVVPTVVIGVGFASTGRAILGVSLIIAAVLLIPLYGWMKAAHIRHLYDMVPVLKVDKQRCHIEDVGAVRLFFWEGILVGSALSAPANTRLHRTAAGAS